MSIPDPEQTESIGAVNADADAPPFSIRFAGLLCIAIGVNSILEMISQIIRGKLGLDLGVVFIPLGWGLLAGRPASRRWLIFFFGCGLVLYVAMAFWMAFAYFGASPHDAAGMRLAIPYLVISVCLATFVVVTLFRTEFRSWFERARQKPAAGASWALPAALVLAIVLGQVSLQTWYTDAPRPQPFPIVTTVECRDFDTRDGLNGISFSPKEPAKGEKDPLAATLSTSTGFTSDGGIAFTIKRVATEPVEFTFSADGYVPETVRITAKSPEKITLYLKRKE